MIDCIESLFGVDGTRAWSFLMNYMATVRRNNNCLRVCEREFPCSILNVVVNYLSACKMQAHPC